MTQAPQVRTYQTAGRSTETFGRVLVSARDQHIIVDGPVQNGCPGEAITPAEMFLSGVAACSVELIQVLAKQSDIPLNSVAANIQAQQDPAKQPRQDVSVFTQVDIDITLGGVTNDQAADLVTRFKRR
jgi:uncharacterized OsmC-like protein